MPYNADYERASAKQQKQPGAHSRFAIDPHGAARQSH